MDFLVTIARGHSLDVNEAYCLLMGYSREELLTMSIPDVEAVEKAELICPIRSIAQTWREDLRTY